MATALPEKLVTARASDMIVGLVSAGVTRERIAASFASTLPAIGLAVGAALVLAVAGAVLLERRLRRRTLGLSFPDLRALYEQRVPVPTRPTTDCTLSSPWWSWAGSRMPLPSPPPSWPSASN
ncbi:MAG: hypothetical protein ACSLE6_01780 [Mycobacterium sp.]